MGGFVDKANGWMALFRIVTPALLAVMLWVLQDSRADTYRQVAEIKFDIKDIRSTLSNHVQSELSSIKERLVAVETQLKVLVKR